MTGYFCDYEKTILLYPPSPHGPGLFPGRQYSAPAGCGPVAIFCGPLTGEGQFSNGKKIAADVSFQLSLDSSWLVYTHRDRAPNSYKADSYWGVDRQTGEFVASCFDNFQGHRQFVSNGWKNGRLILTANAYIPQIGLYFEHFIYEKLSGTSFKMRYETSRDGIAWALGDELVFTKAGS